MNAILLAMGLLLAPASAAGDAAALAASALENFNSGALGAACRDARAALAIDPRNERATGIVKMHCRGKLVGDLKLRAPTRKPGQDLEPERPPNPGTLTGKLAGPGKQPPAPASSLPPMPSGFAQPSRTVSPQTHFESFEKVNEARTLFHQKNLPKALDGAIEALRLNPRNVDAYALISSIYRNARDCESALQAAHQGLTLAPAHPGLLGIKAYCQVMLGDGRGAAETARKAIELNPTDATAYALSARALGMMGDRKGMLAALRKAAAFDPRFGGALQEARGADSAAEIPFYLPGERRPGRTAKAPRSDKRKLIGIGLMLLGLAVGALLMLLGRQNKEK